MKTVAILQARLGSTRLPGKVLLPLLDRPMLLQIIDRVARASLVHAVLVTYPLADEPVLKPLLWPYRVPEKPLYEDAWFDDPNDLVGRYLQAALRTDADLIVRIPCDNPCIDPGLINEAIRKYLSRPQVYVSTMYYSWDAHTYLDGVGAEVFSRNRLQWLDQATLGQLSYREHPHLLFHDQHLIDNYEQHQRHAKKTIRLDVNTQEDYDFIRDLYAHFGHNRFTTADILGYLTTKEAHHETVFG